MKKFFLIPLMTLVCSVMAWGVDVSTFDELKNELTKGTEPTITLQSDITINGSTSIYREVTIDLNGHTLTDGTSSISVGKNGDVTVKNGKIRVNSMYSFSLGTNGTALTFQNVKKVTDQDSTVGTIMYNDGTDVSKQPIHVNQQGGTLTLDSACDLNICSIIVKDAKKLTNNGTGTIYLKPKNTITDNSVKTYLDSLPAGTKIVPSSIHASVYPDYVSYFYPGVAEHMFLTLDESGNGTEIYQIKSTVIKPEFKIEKGEKTYYFKNMGTAMMYSTNEYPCKLQKDWSQATLYNAGYLDLNGKTLTLTRNNGKPIVMVDNKQLTIKNSQPATGGIVFNVTGKETQYAFDITPSSTSVANYSVLTIEEGVTINMPNWKGYFLGLPYDKGYGTVLNMKGTVNVPNGAGITLSGNLKNADDKTNSPIFNISGNINAKTGGIYAAGYGVWNISEGANITGEEFAVGIKSGVLNITGGTLTCNGNAAGRVETYGNGMNSSCAALQIESNEAYAGDMEIAISGGTLISDSWYAIYEYGKGNTAVNSIAVSGGKFQGGILISQSLAAKGGFVSGGKWTKDISANIKTGKNLSLLNNEDDDNPPYLYLVGVPTVAQEADYAEITNQENATDPSKNNNAVLTNAASESAVQSYTSYNVGTNTDDIDVIPTKETNPVVVSENTDVVATEAAPIVEVKKVTVDNDAQLTVTEGATLMVGAGAVTLDENSSNGLTVEAGAALVVEGLVYGSTEENFVIKGQEDKSAIVLFSPETEFIKEDHPTATYRFTSKSFRDGSKWVYQRFGMPSFDGTVTVKSGNLEKNSYICTWDYANDDWGEWSKILADGLVYADAKKAVPFQCYQLGSTNAKDAPITYDFIVELMGNANAPLNFKAGWNPYANSYTAPIDIKEFLSDVIANNGSDILATIYLYKDLGNDTYTWQGINLSNVGKTYRVRENGAMVKKTYDASIEPMQAFIMKLSNGDDATTDINYLNNVYNPAMGIDRPASAPARSSASYNEMQIGAYNDMYWDNISVMEGEQFSAAEDNGYDAPKYDHNKGMSLYVINGEQHMERMATDNADGMFIGINAPVAGTYTLDFSGIVGMNYSIMDMTNNTIVTIEEDGQFNFYAEAGQNDYRFQLVAPARVPTAIENVNAKASAKGVYSISGQYLGEDINALPKGVYIINGAKVVK